MWVPVAVWQPCELLYTCYLLTYLHVQRHWLTIQLTHIYTYKHDNFCKCFSFLSCSSCRNLTHGLCQILQIQCTKHTTNVIVRQTTGCPTVSTLFKTDSSICLGMWHARTRNKITTQDCVFQSLKSVGFRCQDVTHWSLLVQCWVKNNRVQPCFAKSYTE